MKQHHYWKKGLAAALILSVMTGQSQFVLAAEEAFPDEESIEILPDDIAGMPDGYKLTEDEREIKMKLAASGAVDALAELEPGEDYARDEVVCLAEDRAHAALIAEAYGGELTDYSYGVAIISLAGTPLTVARAVRIGAEADIDIPAVEPNYYYAAEDPIVESNGIREEEAAGIRAEGFSRIGWEDLYRADGQFNDPALNPANEKYQWQHGMMHTWAGWKQWEIARDAGTLHEVTVAVIDTGVRATHVEFRKSDGTGSRVTAAEVYSPGVTGEEHYPLGTTDVGGHGTHVAGIIGAASGNGSGGAGIVPEVNFLSICVHDPATGNMPGSSIMQAIHLVAGYDEEGQKTGGRRADIINMSLSGMGYSAAYQETVTRAYKEGITICSTMGNTSANDRRYPAAFDHVIAVASVEQSGAKSGFSTWGDWADIAAPGSEIYSSYYEADDAYTIMSGTSMACPAVSGACALYMSIFGHTDPDNMEKLLKASTNKSPSSHIGAILDIAKLLTKTPGTAKILLKNGSEELQTVTGGNSITVQNTVPATAVIELEADAGEGNGLIVYTTNGKAPAAKNGEITSGKRYTETGIPVSDLLQGSLAKKKITVKATCAAADGTLGAISTLTFTVVPDGTIRVTGQAYIAKGAKAKYKVAKTPGVKGVVWSIKSGDGTVSGEPDQTGKTESLMGVSVNKSSGQVTVSQSAEKGAVFQIIAADKGNAELFGMTTFTVAEGKAGAFSIRLANTSDESLPCRKVTKKNGTLRSLQLFTVNTGKDEFDERTVQLTAGLPEDSAPLWSTSNSAVAEVSPDGTVTATGKGKATITCAAQDGSGKKASVAVSVIVPVSDLSVVSKNGQEYIAYGKSATAQAAAGSVYGTPGNRKVIWRYEAGQSAYDEDSGESFFMPDPSLDRYVKGNNGKVRISPTAAKNDIYMSVRVTATTTDGTEISASRIFYVIPPVKEIGVFKGKLKTSEWGTYLDYDSLEKLPKGILQLKASEDPWSEERYVVLGLRSSKGYDGRTEQYWGTVESELTVTSSNPGVVSANVSFSDELFCNLLWLIPEGTGTAKITIAANDGSGKKTTLTVRVS
ncbi:MAG: S8 family serine peptidase [Lachnospiraceae bacterium]|nr:S8 family serine peptidase [Lachnospiraceae bacterium]